MSRPAIAESRVAHPVGDLLGGALPQGAGRLGQPTVAEQLAGAARLGDAVGVEDEVVVG